MNELHHPSTNDTVSTEPAAVWPPSPRAAGVIAIATTAAAVLMAWFSLNSLPGAEPLFDRRECCTTSRDWMWAAMIVLVLPIGIVARRSVLLAAAPALVSSACAFVVADTIFDRVEQGGWGDGLHTFVYVYAFGMMVAFVVAVAVGRVGRPGSI